MIHHNTIESTDEASLMSASEAKDKDANDDQLKVLFGTSLHT